MTIRELLQKIAQTDELPSRWRVQAQKEWSVQGGQEPREREEIVLEYAEDDEEPPIRWTRFGSIETSSPLLHTSDWIERILVDYDVRAALVLRLQDALGSSKRYLLALEGSPRAMAEAPA